MKKGLAFPGISEGLYEGLDEELPFQPDNNSSSAADESSISSLSRSLP